MKILIVMQCRSNSTRLPNKILKTIMNKPLFVLQMERMMAAKLPTDITIATTTESSDDIIESLCKKNKFNCFRGHPIDLLDRHYQVANMHKADIVIKIPSDCPLIDSMIIDNVIKFYLDNQEKYDFVSNLHPATYPDGNDVEIMPINILETAWLEAKKDYEREHTTPFIWDNIDTFNRPRFRIGNFEWETGLDYSMTHRFTIDYQEDFDFIRTIYEELYPINSLFTLDDILKLLSEKPDIMNINGKYAGVNWYRNYITDLKTISYKQTKNTVI